LKISRENELLHSIKKTGKIIWRHLSVELKLLILIVKVEPRAFCAFIKLSKHDLRLLQGNVVIYTFLKCGISKSSNTIFHFILYKNRK
jgi:hypothetical protein